MDSSHLEKMKEICNKPTTYNMYHKHLNSAFNRAILLKYIKHNPVSIVKRLKVSEKLRRALTFDEFQAICREAIKDKNDKYADFLKFDIVCGCRRNELLNLLWDDVKIGERNFQIRDNKEQIDAVMPLSDLQIDILLKRQDDIKPFDYKPNYATKKFKQYVRSAGLSEDLTFHCLRHTTATKLLGEEVGLFKVQKLLRHSNIKTTMKYEHLNPSFRRSSVETISSMIENLDEKDIKKSSG